MQITKRLMVMINLLLVWFRNVYLKYRKIFLFKLYKRNISKRRTAYILYWLEDISNLFSDILFRLFLPFKALEKHLCRIPTLQSYREWFSSGSLHCNADIRDHNVGVYPIKSDRSPNMDDSSTGRRGQAEQISYPACLWYIQRGTLAGFLSRHCTRLGPHFEPNCELYNLWKA